MSVFLFTSFTHTHMHGWISVLCLQQKAESFYHLRLRMQINFPQASVCVCVCVYKCACACIHTNKSLQAWKKINKQHYGDIESLINIGITVCMHVCMNLGLCICSVTPV